MKSLEINLSEARKLILAGQGLVKNRPFGRGKAAALRALEQLGYVQIDAISVIRRAHHHTFWNRVGNYHPELLHRLMSKDRKVLEYWSHAAAFLPMAHYRFCLHTMSYVRESGHHWYQVEPKVKNYVYDRIADEGPLYARDFVSTSKRSGIMWDLKPAKKALHELFMEGKLLVSARDNFHRRYDLPERILPEGIDTSTPSEKEQAAYYLLTTIRAQGLVALNEVYYLRNWIKVLILKYLHELEEEGVIQAVRIAGETKKIFYTTQHNLKQLPKWVSKSIYFLSPFDNAIIQRKRLQYFFDFNYQTEIYLPPHKRVYGYFALPVLWGTDFIGRLDPKAERKSDVLVIKNLQIEPHVKVSERLIWALKNALHDFAAFNECHTVKVVKTNLPALVDGL